MPGGGAMAKLHVVCRACRCRCGWVRGLSCAMVVGKLCWVLVSLGGRVFGLGLGVSFGFVPGAHVWSAPRAVMVTHGCTWSYMPVLLCLCIACGHDHERVSGLHHQSLLVAFVLMLACLAPGDVCERSVEEVSQQCTNQSAASTTAGSFGSSVVSLCGSHAHLQV